MSEQLEDLENRARAAVHDQEATPAGRAVTDAYWLGREDAGRDWMAVLQKFCAEVHRSGVAVRISGAFYALLDEAKPLMPPALSDDDSEAEADAAEQRAKWAASECGRQIWE